MVRTIRPKLGVFSKFMKFNIFVALLTQLVKKLQQWSLYEVIEDILLFVLNTKRPLSDIWLQSYKQNSFGWFCEKNEVINLSENTQNCFAYISATIYRSEAVLYSKRMEGKMSHKTKSCHIYGADLFNASVDLDECGNFQTAMVKYRYKIDPIQAIYVKSVYSTPQY